MKEPSVYLDYNASALVKPRVTDAVTQALEAGGNPSSVHELGRMARKRVEEARAEVARLAGAAPGQVTFTSGGTEANNMVIAGCRRQRVVVSATEHDSVTESAPEGGRQAVTIPVDGEGILDLGALERLLGESETPALVCVMLANNETGVIQPLGEAAGIAHAHGALLHCDAVQAAGKINVDFAALGADSMSLAAHKIAGPQGVGALILRDGVKLEPLVYGGKQEKGVRSGTENGPGIAGFGMAARLAREEFDDFGKLAELRDGLERRIREIAPRARVFGEGAPRLPNTCCLSMPGVSSETQIMAFDLDGLQISAGAACSSGKVHASHVLTQMGVAADAASCAIRVSLGWGTAPDHIDRFVESWARLYERAGAKAA